MPTLIALSLPGADDIFGLVATDPECARMAILAVEAVERCASGLGATTIRTDAVRVDVEAVGGDRRWFLATTLAVGERVEIAFEHLAPGTARVWVVDGSRRDPRGKLTLATAQALAACGPRCSTPAPIAHVGPSLRPFARLLASGAAVATRPAACAGLMEHDAAGRRCVAASVAGRRVVLAGGAPHDETLAAQAARQREHLGLKSLERWLA